MEVRRKAREWDAWVKGQTTFGPRPQTDLEKAEAWDRLNGRFGGWRRTWRSG